MVAVDADRQAGVPCLRCSPLPRKKRRRWNAGLGSARTCAKKSRACRLTRTPAANADIAAFFGRRNKKPCRSARLFYASGCWGRRMHGGANPRTPPCRTSLLCPCRALVRLEARRCCASPAQVCDWLGGGGGRYRRLESFPIVFCAPCGGRWCGRPGKRAGQARGRCWLRWRHLGGVADSLRLCFRCSFGRRCVAWREAGALPGSWAADVSDGAGGFEVRDRLHQLLRLALRLSAAAALSSTKAAFCWVVLSIWVMASPTWLTPWLCSEWRR